MRHVTHCFFLFAMVLNASCFLVCETARSQDFNQFTGYLKTGEFPAAIQFAEKIGNANQRDSLYARIAEAQDQAGLRRASRETIRRIENDSIRNTALSRQMGRTPTTPPSGAVPRASQGAMGGAAVADFEPLIELIQNTIDPQSWLDTNGGPGTIQEFRSGVTVDARGMLRKAELSSNNNDLLKEIRDSASRKSTNANVFKRSDLRKVSLNRLEKECQILAAEGKDPSEVMERLAGIYEIKYLLVYPESGDIVIAGPAGNWKTDVEGVAVNIDTGKPVLRLDDLVVCLRNAVKFGGKFGCSIDPRQKNLQAFQEFAATTRLKGKKWREGLQNALGNQDISVDGIDPQSIVARVIVEADYRMKLVGMDLEKGVPGVHSFLGQIKIDKNGNLPPLDLMRLEFVLDYDNISVTEGKDAYQLHGRGVKVLSEKELLNQKGERVHTGKASGPAEEFARSFTKHFDDMAARYPIYRQLKNVFDLAMVTNLIKSQGIDKSCKWNMSYFGPENRGELAYTTRKGMIPTAVKTVMNYREVSGRKSGRRVTHLVVGVSGGVTVDANAILKTKDAIKTDTYGKLRLDRKSSKPTGENWWWD